MLTAEEQTLCRELFCQGPTVLFEQGFTPEQAMEFLKRDDVIQHLQVLERDYKNSAEYETRTRTTAKRALGKLSAGAVAILGHSLAGPQYMRNPDGSIKTDAKGKPLVQRPAPTDQQVRTAQSILGKMGVGDQRVTAADLLTVQAGEINIQVILQQAHEESKPAVALKQDPDLLTEEERALSRERIRNAIEKMMPKLQERYKAIEEEKSGKPQGKGRRKKAAAKKARK